MVARPQSFGRALILLVFCASCAKGGAPPSRAEGESAEPAGSQPRGDRFEEQSEPAPDPGEAGAPADRSPELSPSFDGDRTTPTWGPRRGSELQLESYPPAAFWAPESVPTQSLRLVVVAHGAGGRGKDHCRFWDRLFSPDVALLCLAGSPLRRAQPDGGSYFADHFALREELLEAFIALGSLSHLAFHEDDRLFLGYSQGATMGALAVVGRVPFRYLMLVEGGGENWTLQRLGLFEESGGRGVFFACGTRGCASHARRSESIFSSSVVCAALAHAPEEGHTYGGRVAHAVHRQLVEWGYGSLNDE